MTRCLMLTISARNIFRLSTRPCRGSRSQCAAHLETGKRNFCGGGVVWLQGYEVDELRKGDRKVPYVTCNTENTSHLAVWVAVMKKDTAS